MATYKDYVYTFCALGGLLTLLGTSVLHALAWWSTPDIIGLFHLERHSEWVSQKLTVVGASWLMWTWVAVYLTQFIWLAYGLTFPCRNVVIARLLYSTLPPIAHMVYLLSNVSIVVWLFVWDQYRLIQWALLCLLGTTILAPFSMLLMLRAHREACPRLETVAGMDYWLLRGLAHNGVGVHGAWSAVIVLYQIAVIITDQSTLPLEDVHLIFLGLLISYVLFWFAMDYFITLRFNSWVISPYIAFLLLTFGMFIHNYRMDTLRLFLTLLLGLICIIVSIAKTWLMVRQERHVREREKNMEETVRITSLEKDQLDRIEKIDMINKMFEY